jgi:hypothetical protein
MEDRTKKVADSPAFASVGYSASGDGYCQEGLTTREYFAAKAMQGICVNAGRNSHDFHDTNKIAKTSVEIADALISALVNEA